MNVMEEPQSSNSARSLLSDKSQVQHPHVVSKETQVKTNTTITKIQVCLTTHILTPERTLVVLTITQMVLSMHPRLDLK